MVGYLACSIFIIPGLLREVLDLGYSERMYASVSDGNDNFKVYRYKDHIA